MKGMQMLKKNVGDMNDIDFMKRIDKALDNESIPKYEGCSMDIITEAINKWMEDGTLYWFKVGYMCALEDMEAQKLHDNSTEVARQ